MQIGTILAERRRPSSAFAKFSGSALNQALHPAEQLGKGMGTNIGLSGDNVILLADRHLARRVDNLKVQLQARQKALGTESAAEADSSVFDKSFTLTGKRRQSDNKAVQAADLPSHQGSDDDSDQPNKSRVRSITDLRPDEMARLESRFKGDKAERGLEREEFERAMAEYTGMEGHLGTQLFCKIDANDDGNIVW